VLKQPASDAAPGLPIQKHSVTRAGRRSQP
jgi:hypothetical protein